MAEGLCYHGVVNALNDKRMLAWAAAAVALAGCEPQPPEPAAQNNVAAEQPRQPPIALPQPEPPLDRERLLLAVVRARSAQAAGLDDREAQAELDGDRFELRVRFGCGAPPEATPLANPTLRHDADARTITIKATPDIGLADPLVAALGGEGIEAAEGFWIPRPWILQPACPTGQATSAVLGPARVGLAQFFTEQDSRVGRRDERAYSTILRLEEGQDPARPLGYDLIITGRLRAGPQGGVIRCLSPDPNAIPTCLIGAEFEQVRLIDVERGNELARWSRG